MPGSGDITSNAADKNATDIGLIVGLVLGGIVLVLIVVALLYCKFSRCKHQGSVSADKDGSRKGTAEVP